MLDLCIIACPLPIPRAIAGSQLQLIRPRAKASPLSSAGSQHVSLVSARPWDDEKIHFSPGFADFCRLCHDAVSFYFFSMVSCPFQPEVPSNLQLLCPILSISTCHSCYTSACTAFSACTFTAMPLASTNLTLFCLISKVLHKATFTSGSFTQTLFYTKHFLPKPTFRPTNFYTNPLLNKLAFPQTTFHTNQLLHKPCFGPVGQRPESRQNAKGC